MGSSKKNSRQVAFFKIEKSSIFIIGIIVLLIAFSLFLKITFFSKKKTAPIAVAVQYKNPFEKATQYQNPFDEYQNPIDDLVFAQSP